MLRNSSIPNDAIKQFEETYEEELHLMAVIKLCDMSEMLAEMIFDLCWEGA
ncbi:hypothetical protein DPMN_077293 [Dreissena polymorpha]|uniref:Uncharacterized protein n=1 Tax=Dreissena polymorpha TaxID=45954 RepID=A0A9D3YKP2_DREPO|nr:hypothetical protein DPMN_077293 [Dreissena polymorpha]